MDRAWSTLQIKSAREVGDQRLIQGTCSTPSLDRENESVDLATMRWKTPMPLLYQHNSREPCGHVLSLAATAGGLQMTARVAQSDDPSLEKFLSRVWANIKARLTTGLSIGFLAGSSEPIKSGGRKWLSAEIVEVSVVTIPANADCGITTIKSLDLASIARNAKRPAPSPKSWMAIELERLTRDANRELFKSRPFTIEYHDGPVVGALAYPERRAISFHEALLDMPNYRLAAIAIHELAHLACAGEKDHHGPSWRRAMMRVGVHPDTGAILYGSPARKFVDEWR